MQYHYKTALRTYSVFRLVPLSVGFLLMAAISQPANAQWRIDPLVRLGGEYDDNATLDIRTDQEIALRGYLVEAGADFAYTSELTSFSFFPRLLLRNYSDNPEFDSDDIFLNARIEREMQFSTLGFRANFDRQPVRRAERADADIDVDDPDNIPGDDSGRVGLLGDRDKWRLTPSWSYRFSDVSSLDAVVDYFDVSYDEVFAGVLTDYSDAHLNLTYRRGISDRTSLVLLGTGRTFDSAQPDANEIQGFGLLAGFDRDLSEKTSLRAMVGAESTDQSIGNDVTEVVGNVTLIRRLETINMLAQYRRSVSASGAGKLSLRDQVSINFDRRLNEKISAGIGIRAYHSQNIGEADNSLLVEDREYIQLRTRFIWFLTEAFTIEMDYRYTVLDRGATIGEIANSNLVSLWFGYRANNPDL